MCVLYKRWAVFHLRVLLKGTHLLEHANYNQMVMLLKFDRLKKWPADSTVFLFWPAHYFRGKLNLNVSRKISILPQVELRFIVLHKVASGYWGSGYLPAWTLNSFAFLNPMKCSYHNVCRKLSRKKVSFKNINLVLPA